jgi:hypothetical protein
VRGEPFELGEGLSTEAGERPEVAWAFVQALMGERSVEDRRRKAGAAGAMTDFQIRRNEFQTSRNEIQAGRNKLQIRRNEIQMHYQRLTRVSGLIPHPASSPDDDR